MKKAYHKRITSTISVSVMVMGLIYIAIGIVPSSSIWNMIISVLMVVTCIGSFPLYLGPVNELFDGKCGKVKTNKYFITNPQYIGYRVVEVVGLSVLAFVFNDFKAVLNFNILLLRSVGP